MEKWTVRRSNSIYGANRLDQNFTVAVLRKYNLSEIIWNKKNYQHCISTLFDLICVSMHIGSSKLNNSTTAQPKIANTDQSCGTIIVHLLKSPINKRKCLRNFHEVLCNLNIRVIKHSNSVLHENSQQDPISRFQTGLQTFSRNYSTC